MHPAFLATGSSHLSLFSPRRHKEKSVLGLRVWKGLGRVLFLKETFSIGMGLCPSPFPTGSTVVRLEVKQLSCDHEEHKNGQKLDPKVGYLGSSVS